MSDLYVSTIGSDSNPGTQAQPFQTILAASQMARPGDTIHVAPGTYYGGFQTTASGTAAAPIHYVSDVKWGAVIVPAPNSTYDMGWDNRGAYVAIDGFQVDATNYQSGTVWRAGIYTTGSGSILENNNVHNIATNISLGGNGGVGIEGDSYYGGSNISLIGNIVHDIGLGSDNTVHGIYQTASGTIANNLVYGAAGWGIALWHDANHINIVNNTVFNNVSGGITVGGGDFINTSGPDDYDYVANNIVYGNPYGIDEFGATGTHNVYTNNLVSNNGTNWALQNGLTASNTVTAAPNFVNYTGTSSGDYHLAAGSPAIDAGTATNAPSTDLAGVARPQGAGYDIGAYEFVTSTPSPSPTPTPTPTPIPTPATTDLYVSPNGSDSNPGTQAAPFQTILAASQAAQPGSTIHVAPGIYAGGFTTTASGTASNPIHYVSDTKWGAVIVPGANSASNMAWNNSGTDVTIDGFQVDGSQYQSGTPWRFGIYSSGSNSIVENNKVHDIATDAAALTDPNGAAGIMGDSYYGGSNIALADNIVYNIGPASGAGGSIQGIDESTSGAVTNNLVNHVNGWGIALWHDANHVNILNNTVLDNSSGGITVGGGDFYHTSGPNDFDFVANNVVYNNPVGVQETGATGTHNVYTNNLVSTNGTNWALQNGLTASSTVTAAPNFVNNTGTSSGDYHLAAGSPGIDAGTATNAPATDLDGVSRPQGAGYDIGAYEFVTSTPAPSPTPTPSSPQPFTLPVSGAWTDSIIGTRHADTLTGTAANDYINGKAGADTMIGGAGDDTYVVNTSGDTVIENSGGGIDTVLSKAGSYTLPANVENLTLIGTNAQSGTGNELDNLITAGSGNDVINGGAGNDIIKAGTGADVLTGGPGNDMFVFSAVGAKSTVTDFHVGEDLLDLRPLLQASGYTGTDPVADHTIALMSDGAGGTTVTVDPTHSGTLHPLVTLQNLAPTAVHVGSDVIWH